MSNSDLLFYGLYGSKYNKETIHSLKYEMTFLELMVHKQFIDTQEDLEAESYQQTQDDRK